MRILYGEEDWLIGVNEDVYNRLLTFIGEAAPIVYHEGMRLAIVGSGETKTASQVDASNIAARLGYYAGQAGMTVDDIVVTVFKNEQDEENYLITIDDEEEEEL